jgi:RimJ/RimL family protein N-acetyltransferase
MQSTDIEALYRILNEPRVRKYLLDDKLVSPAFIDEIFRQSLSNFASLQFGLWILREKPAAQVIGFCGLRRVEDLAETEILYALSESKWHCGYAIEATCAVKRYAFERAGLDRLIGITDLANFKSWRVLERLGMREYRPVPRRTGSFDRHHRPGEFQIMARARETGDA